VIEQRPQASSQRSKRFVGVVEKRRRFDALRNAITRDRVMAGSVTLGSGMVVSQGLALATTPILTRLYSAEAFGILAVYSSAVGILSIVVSLRYEFAIPLPRSRSTALRLVQIATVLTILGAGMLGLVAFIGRQEIVALLGLSAAPYILAVMPIGIGAVSVYQVLSFWALRERAYGVVAQTRVRQGLGRAVVQIIGAFALAPSLALVLGDLIGQTAGIARLSRLLRRRDWYHLRRLRPRAMRSVGRRYRHFPQYSLPSNVLAISAHQGMPLFIGAVFGGAPAGLFGLAYRLMQTPINLLNGTVSRAYYAEAMRANTDAPETLVDLYRGTLKKLALIGLVPGVVVLSAGPLIFRVFFGNRWVEAGLLASILSPAIYFQALASPLSQTLLIVEKQRLNLVLDAFRICVLASGMALARALGLPFIHTVTIYAALMAALYATNLLVYDRAIADVVRARHERQAC
jgi:O-antigen/teichoic acid export membrane protein